MKTEKIFIILVLFVVMLIALSSVSPDFFSGLKKATITGSSGFTVDSITTTQFISNDNDIQTANFRVAISATGDAESIVGTIDSTEFSKYKSNLGNVEVTYPLKIDLSEIKEKLQYSIANQGAIYQYTQKPIDRPGFWTPAECGASETYQVACFIVPYVTGGSHGVGDDRVIKVFKTPVGNYGLVNRDSITWEGKMTFTLNGRPISQTLTSSTGTVEFYDGTTWLGNVKWSGDKVTSVEPPNTAAYRASYLTGVNRWKISDVLYYDDYNRNIEAMDAKIFTLRAISVLNEEGASEVNTLISVHKQVLTKFIDQDRKIDYSSVSATNNDKITETITRKYRIPTAVITLKASQLGILIPVGKPSIISTVLSPFSSGDSNGVLTVTVKNIGTAKGTFSATFTDQSGTFTPIDDALTARVTLEPSQTGDIRIRIGHGTNIQASKTALVKVVDVNSPTKNFAEKYIVITMTTPKACVPNSVRTEGESVWTCRADGSQEDLTFDCTGKGLDYTNGKYSCKLPSGTSTGTPTSTSTTGGNDIISTPAVQKWYENPWFAIGLIITIISGLYYISTKNK